MSEEECQLDSLSTPTPQVAYLQTQGETMKKSELQDLLEQIRELVDKASSRPASIDGSSEGAIRESPATRVASSSDPPFLAHFRPASSNLADSAEKMLIAAGVKPILQTASGSFVIKATRSKIEELTSSALKEKSVPRSVNRASGSAVRRSYAGFDSTQKPPLDNEELGRFGFPIPFDYHQAPSAYPPRVNYYHLHPSRDLAHLFGVEPLHANGIRGQGIRVVMIDSGFYRHPYYEDRALHGGDIPQITTHGVMPGGNPESDDVGHGTGIAANTLAIAPSCDFHHIKDDDDPLAAFALARSLNPNIISCSWGWSEAYVSDVFNNSPNSGAADYLRDLEAEISAAIADDITVLFAAGNGDAPGSWPSSVPGVICVGGALVDENLELLASSYATSFASLLTAGRVCPDVCGLVGPSPSGLLFSLPTQPNNQFDQNFSAVDGTRPGDGWLIASGTSSATPQLAGVAALLMQMNGAMTPDQVLERFRAMAVGVHQGVSATGQVATGVRPNAPTGHGWVTFRRPQLQDRYAFF